MDFRNMIPNQLSSRFNTPDGRRELLEKYGDSPNMYVGENSDGEKVMMYLKNGKGIVLKTYQKNGRVRVNFYDEDGCNSGETFDGRWNK